MNIKNLTMREISEEIRPYVSEYFMEYSGAAKSKQP